MPDLWQNVVYFSIWFGYVMLDILGWRYEHPRPLIKDRINSDS